MANPEHVELLKQGAEVWNRWRMKSGEKPDLVGADLRGANLRGANLRRTDLREVNFRDANLRDIDFGSALLTRADLSDADLRRAVLRRADLSGANLARANLQEAVLLYAQCGSSAFLDIDLSQVLGLDEVTHLGPSSIGTDTLRKTAASLRARQVQIETFLRGAGVGEEYMAAFRASIGQPG